MIDMTISDERRKLLLQEVYPSIPASTSPLKNDWEDLLPKYEDSNEQEWHCLEFD
jgi:hypothetical protein